MSSTVTPKIVVVGAGFAGLSAIRRLARADADVILIDSNSYHTFVPLLYQVATGFIGPEVIAYPIQQVLQRYSSVRFLQGTVTQVDVGAQTLEVDGLSFNYDYLVLATGSQTRVLPVPGTPDHSLPLRTLDDAVALHKHLLRCVERAATHPEAQGELLTVAVVGGGATGVEVAGAVIEFFNDCLIKDSPELSHLQARVLLIQSGDRLLVDLPRSLGRRSAAYLRRRGVKVHLGTQVKSVSPTAVTLDDGFVVPTATVVWAAGIEANLPAVAGVARTEKGKALVQPTLQLHNAPNVYVVGDAAAVKQANFSGVAPEALQQGKAVAQNIRRQIQGEEPQPFKYFNKGRAAIVARSAGVAHLLGRIPVTGALGWLVWLGVHLYYLPGLANRWTLLKSWLRDYVKHDRIHREPFQSWKNGDRP